MSEKKHARELTEKEKGLIDSIVRMNKFILALVLVIASYLLYDYYQPYLSFGEEELVEEISEIEDGIDVATGLIAESGYKLIKQNCISCHSSKLIIQNRMSYEGWQSSIRWMQETQNFWDLGDKEEPILAYLAKHYAPGKVGRRKALVVEEWYMIE